MIYLIVVLIKISKDFWHARKRIKLAPTFNILHRRVGRWRYPIVVIQVFDVPAACCVRVIKWVHTIPPMTTPRTLILSTQVYFLVSVTWYIFINLTERRIFSNSDIHHCVCAHVIQKYYTHVYNNIMRVQYNGVERRGILFIKTRLRLIYARDDIMILWNADDDFFIIPGKKKKI